MTKTLTFFFLLTTFVLFFLSACTDTTETVTIKQDPNALDTLNLGGLGSYDINPADTKERINQVYGKQHIKEGHWITFGFTASKTGDNKADRIKIEEGYYRKNKKVGYWKTFNDDGTLKDSVAYQNGVPVTSK